MDIELRENIDWVGYVDWTVRDFHSFKTTRGATYNAYLVRDEKTALIDTVKAPFAERLLKNVAELTDLQKVDYVVCNHAEPDHAGGLPRIMATLPNATLVCNKKCEVTLGRYFDTSDWKIKVVADGDALSLGKRTLQFVATPMLHWPESMFTYVPEEKVLFSMDAFGQHIASSARFDDEVDMAQVMEEAKSYYANIVMPFGKQVAGTLEKAAALDIEIIATSHGVIWRSHLDNIIEAYKDWSVCRPQAKVLVIYDSMWDSTGQMARQIIAGASMSGVEAKLIHIRKASLTSAAAEVLDAATVAFGSATLNRGMMPMMGAVLTYFKGLRPTGKAGFAFGSYGWGKGAPEAINGDIEEMGWEIMREPIKAQYRPRPDVLADCREAGRMLAEKAKTLSRN